MIFEKLNSDYKKIADLHITGFSNIEIAEEIGYCERTINRKLKELCQIYNVRRCKELTLKIIIDKFSLDKNKIFTQHESF